MKPSDAQTTVPPAEVSESKPKGAGSPSEKHSPPYLIAGMVGVGIGIALAAACFALVGRSDAGLSQIGAVWKKGYDTIGLVIIGLIPLTMWMIILMIQQFCFKQESRFAELDYSFIGRTATQLGLLGTVISLGIATSQLADDVRLESSAAILKVIPLTGQALFSTMAGIIVSIIANTALHLVERKELRNESLSPTPVAD